MNRNKYIIDSYISGHLDREGFIKNSKNFNDEDWLYFEHNLEAIQYEKMILPQETSDRLLSNILDHKKLKVIQFYKKNIIAIAAVFLIVFGMTFFLNNLNQFKKIELFANNSESIQYITTPDGSQIRLFPNSNVFYTATNNSREIELEGKATFDIKSDVKKPLQVKTNFSFTRVIGTVFTIDTQNDSIETLHLHEGSIEYGFKSDNDSIDSVFLKDHGEVSFNKKRLVLERKFLKEEITYDRTTSIVQLNNADISKVADVLKVWYNVEINYPQSLTEKIVHRFDTKAMKVDEVIEGINLITNYKIIKISPNRYEIK